MSSSKKYTIQNSPFIVPTTDGKLIEEHFGQATDRIGLWGSDVPATGVAVDLRAGIGHLSQAREAAHAAENE